jgi:DNA topoisomerase-3
VLVVAGWRGVYGELSESERAQAKADDDAQAAAGADVALGAPAVARGDADGADDDEAPSQRLPRVAEGEDAATRQIDSARKETKPPRRYSDASLLAAMETAGKLVDDDELREAMKESGIGTPATRAAIIERLIDVGYIEREGRALVATEKGTNVISLLDNHALTSPGLTGEWEHRLRKIEQGSDSRESFMAAIASFAQETVAELDTKLKDVRIPRANVGPCPVCGRDIIENRKGYSCWSREDPGCGFVIWKGKVGKQLPASIAKELIRTGYTAQAVTGFRNRSGKSFRARLALGQTEDGKWRVEFDEPWAKEGAKPPEEGDADGAARTEAVADGALTARTAA